MRLRAWVAGVAVLLLVGWVAGQDVGNMTVSCPTLSAEPKIDGVVSPGEWEDASGSVIRLRPGMGGDYEESAGRFRVGVRGHKVYLLFINDQMAVLPKAEADGRDDYQRIAEDDFVEFFIGPRGKIAHLLANARGAFADDLNNDRSWNGAWTVAAQSFGLAQNTQTGEARRGMVVEAVLDLQASGLPLPADGQTWLFQVITKNPHLTWALYRGGDVFQSHNFGSIQFGAPAGRIERIEMGAGNRSVIAHVWPAGGWKATATSVGKEPIVASAVGEQIVVQVPGNREYQWELIGGALRLSFNARSASPVPIKAVLNPSFKSFYIQMDSAPAGQEIGGTVRMRFVRDGKDLWQKDINLDEVKQRTGFRVSYDGWGVGPVQMIVDRPGKAGKVEELTRFDLEVPPTPPWANFKLPDNAPVVPWPFEPVKADDRKANVVLRTYELGGTPFLDQVISSGEPLLQRPVELRAVVGGKPIRWQMRSWKQVSADDEKVVYEGLALPKGKGGLRLKVRSTLEYDGMLRLDWALEPLAGAVKLDSVQFVVPLRPEVAKRFFRTGTLNFDFNNFSTWFYGYDLEAKPWASEFVPTMWLGDSRRGLSWFTDTPAGWAPANPQKAIEIIPGKDAVELVLNVRQEPTRIEKPLSYTFGLIASPIQPKPHPADYDADRVVFGGHPVELLGANELYRPPFVLIPTGAEDMPAEGCLEVDFRVDWDPEAPPAGKPQIELMGFFANWGAYGQRLVWDAATRSLMVRGPQWEPVTALQVPVTLQKGQWYRAALNWGREPEIILNGQSLGRGKWPLPWPQWQRQNYFRLAGNGMVSLRGWRTSNRPRTAAEVRMPGQFNSDEATRHLAVVDSDPTVLNWLDPQVGGLTTPAYLNGNWRYDAQERCLVPGADLPAMKMIEHLAKVSRVRTYTFHYWSKLICGHGGPSSPDLMAQAVTLANQLGMRLAPYIPDGISSNDPYARYYLYEYSGTGPEKEPQPWWRESGQMLYSGGAVGAGRDYNLYQLDQILKLGISGVYLDGYPGTGGYNNPLLNLQTRDPFTGQAVAKINVFAKRELMKDFIRLVQSYHGNRYTTVAHITSPNHLMTMGGQTTAFGGESLGWLKNWQREVAPDAIAASYYGQPFGFNAMAEFHANRPVPIEMTWGALGIWGMPPILDFRTHLQRGQRVFELADRFDVAGATWIDPDNAANPFVTGQPGVMASAFVHHGKRVLLQVLNTTEQAVDVKVKVDWEKLGLAPDAPVLHLNTNRPMPLDDGAIRLHLKPYRIQYIWIGAEGDTGSR